MKKLATLGVAAALSMAVFAPLTTIPAYATGPIACGEVAVDGSYILVEDTTTDCVVKMAFSAAVDVDDLVIELSAGLEALTDSDYTVAVDGVNVTVTIKADAVDTMRGEYGGSLSVAASDAVDAETIQVTILASPISIQYAVLDGDNQTWDASSDAGLTIRYDGNLTDIIGFEIINITKLNALRDAGVSIADLSLEEQAEIYYEDWYDNLHEGTDYTLAAGSTIVTISRDFLASLPAGEYQAIVYYNDGDGAATFTISGSATTSTTGAPDTGVMTVEKSASATVSVVALVASVLTTLAGAAMVARRQARK